MSPSSFIGRKSAIFHSVRCPRILLYNLALMHGRFLALFMQGYLAPARSMQDSCTCKKSGHKMSIFLQDLAVLATAGYEGP